MEQQLYQSNGKSEVWQYMFVAATFNKLHWHVGIGQ